MEQVKILWADDEIDLLKPHIIFLETKGYQLTTCVSGSEAIEWVEKNVFDIVFLDENMPGLSGLETLQQIKKARPGLPIVMITKSEEERIMEDAIGSQIADYLIKPVNPNQILLCLKKILENKKLISEKTAFSYQQQFNQLGMAINASPDSEEWKQIYKQLVFWELELEKSKDSGISEVLEHQKTEANNNFCRFVEKNYTAWLSGTAKQKPDQSHTILKNKLFPILSSKPICLILIDNLRYDQWKALQPIMEEMFRVVSDNLYFSILPTTTQFARNAFFAGLLPSEIEKKYPSLWLDDDDEGTKNQYEQELLSEYLKRYGKNIKFSYTKVLNLNAGKKLAETMPNLMGNDLNVIVYNFVDMLSHARTDMEVIKELADDERAYRSLTISWFMHSPLYDILQFLSQKKVDVIITTDHGSVKTTRPVRLAGDKDTNTNLRFKYGKNLQYNPKEVFEIKRPSEVYLPRINIANTYVFCRAADFFVYPNNYNYFAQFYRNTFQHGGISLEEMLIPWIQLTPR